MEVPAHSGAGKLLTVLSLAALAIMMGLGLSLMGSLGLVFVVAIGVAIMVAVDYRVGVVALVLILPVSNSPLLPQSNALNPVNYILLWTLLVLLSKKLFSPKHLIWPPIIIICLMVLPLIAGVLLGLPRLDEAIANADSLSNITRYSPENYTRQFIYHPLKYIIFSVLVANAVADSRNRERFISVFALSVAVAVIYLIGYTFANGVRLGDHRFVINRSGMHYNEYGKLFSIAFGPLLYLTVLSKGRARIAFGSACLLSLTGLVFTFARAGMLSAIVVVALLFYRERSIKAGFAVALIAIALVFLAPQAWQDRMLLGFGEKDLAAAQSGKQGENFSSGRIGTWLILAPEVASSPIFGRGTSSTAWSSAAARGEFDQGHAHNLYLGVLLDLGVVGLLVIVTLYLTFLRWFVKLSKDESIEPRLRIFFSGSAASMVGMFVLSFTGGYWYPHVEQTYLWFIVGVAFYYLRGKANLSPSLVNRARHASKEDSA